MDTARNGSRDSGYGERSTSALAGASCGHYRILDLLGSGGMGEVWRAVDTRLGREVALKMLPGELAEDPERMARFTGEAKVLASLNHPNIAVLYGLESLSPSPAPAATESPTDTAARPWRARPVLVMELVEGAGLDEMVARGPLPRDEAVSIALQIAEGLQAAHRRGIVHRDLKPANVKVRTDGTVKVLDFGLAITGRDAEPDDARSLDPTLTRNPTLAGTVVGTAAYMSPEQARGRPVDRRTDIWAFGCLLFEMLSGTRAFHGDTLSDTMAAVLKDEPGWDALPADLEPVTRHVLRRCLAKDPERRFHDIADVRIELEEAMSVAAASPPRRRSGRRGMRVLLLVATVAAAAAVAAVRTREPVLPTFRALSFHSGRVLSGRFGPDDETVVYGMSTRERPLALLSTRADSVESRPLDLPAADILGISRTGQMAVLLDRHCEGSWVSVGTLALADLAGGAPRSIMERVNDGDIADDGRRLAVAREHGTTQRLEYPVGKVLFETGGWISHVRIAPDGERVAFLHHPYYGDDRGLVAMVSSDGELTKLTEELSDSLQGLAWSPDGREVWFSAYVFGQGGVVWSVRPGARPVERLRSPISVRLQDIAADGRALLIAGDSRAEIAGRLAGDDGERRYEGWNDDSIGGIAADGSLFAGNMQVATVDGEYAAFARRSDGLPPVRLGYGDVFGVSPHGEWVFTRRMTDRRNTLTLVPTGAGEPRVIDLGPIEVSSSSNDTLSSSLDGRTVAFSGFEHGRQPQIYVARLDDESVRVVAPPATTWPVISPDGSRVAAVAPDGQVSIYPVAGGEVTRLANAQRGELPLQWTEDGAAVLLWDRVFPALIHRVGLADGGRELALTLMPDNPAGVMYGQILLAPGGRYYLYRYRRDLSTLYLVDGIR